MITVLKSGRRHLCCDNINHNINYISYASYILIKGSGKPTSKSFSPAFPNLDEAIPERQCIIWVVCFAA